MRIILTGNRGVGKTTVCRRVIEIARKKGLSCVGTITSQQGEDLLVEDISTGERRLLAVVTGSKEIPDGIPSCHFLFSREGIEFGRGALRKEGALLIIDEFGRLELTGRGFDNALAAFKKHRSAILVVRDILKDELLEKLDGVDLRVVEITERNREEAPREIFELACGDVNAH